MHVTCIGEKNALGFWLGNLNERNHLLDIGIDEKIILKRILKK
jgi:hypothetical protein